MIDLLFSFYPWAKAFHIMSVLAWMAGLFYLPRLFVYHSEEVSVDDKTDALFQKMEFKLLKVIMGPAIISTWFFGLLLVFTPGIVDWTSIWPWTKGISVFGMTWFHFWLSVKRKDFAMGKNMLSGRTYRMMNEVPTILMVIIVLSVILKF